MTAKMTQADFDAMFEAASAAGIVGDVTHKPDPAWLAKSKRGQEAARAGVEAEQELREPSVGEKAASFMAGAAESASMGAAPYLYGAVRAMDPFVRPGQPGFVVDDPISGIPKRFREGVEEQREGMESMHEGKLGGAFGGGHLTADLANAAAGVAAPLKSAAQAGKAIAGGAPASSVLSTGMRPLIDRVRGALSEPLKAAGERAAEARSLTPVGATGASINAPKILREVERFPGGQEGFSEWMRTKGVSRDIALPTGIAKRAEALNKSSGELIGEQIARATKKGGVVDVRELAARLRADAKEAAGGLQSMNVDPRIHAAELNKFADDLEALAPSGVAKLQDVKDLSVSTGKQAGSGWIKQAADESVPGKRLALMDARRAYEDAIAKGIEKTGVATPEEIQAAKRDYQGSLIASEAANESLGRAAKSGPIGLTTTIIGSKNPAAALGYALARPLYASGRATALETARSLGEAIAPALTSAQTATVQRALAAGNTPQMISQAMQLPLDAIEALAMGTAVKPSSAFALGKSALSGAEETDRLEAMKKRLAAP